MLQHLAKSDAVLCFREISRVLRPAGMALVEMPNLFGLRALYHQSRRGFRSARRFEVRYWTPAELKGTFESIVGPTRLLVDGYLSINPQASDTAQLPHKYRLVVAMSEFFKHLSQRVPLLTNVADSLYVLAENERVEFVRPSTQHIEPAGTA